MEGLLEGCLGVLVQPSAAWLWSEVDNIGYSGRTLT